MTVKDLIQELLKSKLTDEVSFSVNGDCDSDYTVECIDSSDILGGGFIFINLVCDEVAQ